LHAARPLLQSINVINNQLQGTIPKEFTKLDSLVFMSK